MDHMETKKTMIRMHHLLKNVKAFSIEGLYSFLKRKEKGHKTNIAN